MDVAAWLRGLGLEQYEPAFRDNFVDADVLPDLTAEDLVGLGVTAILFAAAQARGLMSPSLTALASILITISMLQRRSSSGMGSVGQTRFPRYGATRRMKDGFPSGRYYAPRPRIQADCLLKASISQCGVLHSDTFWRRHVH
jgi:hypothetical protein